jgi:hypothetical protein
VYKKYGSTILPSILFSKATPIFWLADAEAIKVVTTERYIFQKELDVVRLPSSFHDVANMFCSHSFFTVWTGQLLGSQYSDDGRRHLETSSSRCEPRIQRGKVHLPHHFLFDFSLLVKANTALVWSETNRLLAEWFADIQARKDGEYHLLDLNPQLIEVRDTLNSQ